MIPASLFSGGQKIYRWTCRACADTEACWFFCAQPHFAAAEDFGESGLDALWNVA